jgi:hypothetical protein
MRKETRKDEKKTEFQLTDSITSSTIGTPASLRSENDQLHLGTSDWDPIGISNHLHRNKQHDKENQKHGCNNLSVTYSSSLFMSSVPARIRFWQMANSQRMPLAQPAPAGVS